MSTYQYYEFRKIESSLSDEAMQEISDLSSRAQVSRTSALFTYNYGDFRGDSINVLTQHFDALFYTASWGSRRLAFRFSISAINYEVFRRFAFCETIDIKRKDAHLIVDLFFQDESLCDWVDGEGTLDRVIEVYDDLLAEDYRPLQAGLWSFQRINPILTPSLNFDTNNTQNERLSQWHLTSEARPL